MQIKEYNKQGLIAWSNSKSHSELLASASLQQESSLYNIDILSLDLQQRSKKLNIIGNGYTDSPFRCIAWDNFGQKQNTFQHGVIFTGMQNGSFKLWNPAQMINTYSNREIPSINNIEKQTCILYQEEAEEGAFPVMCAEWNSLKNNFLAFGSTDVLIVDMNNDPSDPQLIKPGKKNPHDGSYVTSVSWNRQVAHILASASENGLVALWDIKTNNSIFQFKDSGASSSGNRNVVICWSKNISTQIAVTLDDQKRNQLQIWDLRNQKGPVVVIDRCHSKGINCMDWCQTDPELILTASRDRQVVCWNYTQDQQPLSETQLNETAFNVKWSKKLPSIYSVSTDQKTSIYTLSDANLFSYVPKWHKIPVGSTFLGNEAVLTYSQQRGNVLHQNKIQQITKKVLQPKLKTISNILQGKFDEQDNDSQISAILKAKSGGDNDNQIYDYLGFSKSKIVQEVQKYTGKRRQFFTGGSGTQKQKNVKPKPKAYTKIQGQDALSFFSNIGSKTFEQPQVKSDDQDNQNVKYDMVPRNFNWDIGKEGMVKQNILIGNYEGAIDAALKCGRTAQALIIAYSVGQTLFNNTLKTFFTETTDNFITDILKNIAYKDPFELVNKYELQKWKECIALIYSISSRDKRPQLLRALAERLRKQTEDGELEVKGQILSQTYAAVVCYILADDFAEIASIYYNNLNIFSSGTVQRKLAAIQYGKRLISIYESLTVQAPDLKIFNKIVREIAFIAIEQGQKSIAHSIFVKYLPSNHRNIDYLISSTKELEKYRSSINNKFISLPVMQPKKVQKKNVKTENKQNVGQKKKNPPPVVVREEETKPFAPPPIGKKKVEAPQTDIGFSPYEGNQAKSNTNNQPPPKKNNNTPPPPPPSHKKAPQQHYEEQQQPEREVHPPVKSAPTPPPATVKKTPPPPPPQSHTPQPQINQSYDEEPVASKPPPIKGPPKSIPPPPPAERKLPPQPIAPVKQSPPPPAKREVYEEEEQTVEIKHQPPPSAPKKKIPPPPPAQTQKPEHEYYQEEHHPKRGPPPSSKHEEPIQAPPQIRKQPPQRQQRQQEKKRYEQPAEQQQQPVKRSIPPPPPTKKGPPPPPPRR